jgi:hypothetical protein
MSFRVEWFDALATVVAVVPRGFEFGEYAVTEDVAIVFDGDEGAALEGPADQVRGLLVAALAELDRLVASGEIPAAP